MENMRASSYSNVETDDGCKWENVIEHITHDEPETVGGSFFTNLGITIKAWVPENCR